MEGGEPAEGWGGRLGSGGRPHGGRDAFGVLDLVGRGVGRERLNGSAGRDRAYCCGDVAADPVRVADVAVERLERTRFERVRGDEISSGE